MNTADRPTVFISHSSADAATAMSLCDYLERHGVKCWIAPRDIVPGAAYPSEITRGIKLCDIFVVILTVKSVLSPHVNTETDIAFNNGKRIIPYFAHQVSLGDSMSYYLARKQWILAYDNPEQSLKDLLYSIRPESDDGEESAADHTNMTADETRHHAVTSPTSINNKALRIVLCSVIALFVIAAAVSFFDRHDYDYRVSESPYKPSADAAVSEAVKVIGSDAEEHADRSTYYKQPTTSSGEIFSITAVDSKEVEARWKITGYMKQISISVVFGDKAADDSGLTVCPDCCGSGTKAEKDITIPCALCHGTGRINPATENGAMTHLIPDHLVCTLFQNKRALEGLCEDYDGANVGYFEGKISGGNREYRIKGRLVLENGYNYITRNVEAALRTDAKTSELLDNEMNKTYD